MSRILYLIIGLSLLLAVAVGPAVQAQTGPAVDIRAYLVNLPWAATPTLADITWQQSNIRKQYVCPACGYSSATAGACPNVWGLHGAGVALLNLGSRRDRVINSLPWGTNTQSDLIDYDYGAGAPVYNCVVGQPFHPTTTDVANNPVVPYGAVGSQVYVRVGIKLPLDVDGDGTDDIPTGAGFRLIYLPPGEPVPTDQISAETQKMSQEVTPVGDLLDFSAVAANIYALPTDAHGVGRIYLEWQPVAGGPGPWYYNTLPSGATLTPQQIPQAAYYCSRLMVPRTEETWRLGNTEMGGSYLTPAIGSYLARLLVAPLVGGARDDLYMPGATTTRRNFALLNRATITTSIVERLDVAPLEPLMAGIGLRAAGRSTVRPSLPDGALLAGPLGNPNGCVAAGAVDSSHWVQVRIPSYQPASELGDTLAHNAGGNWGYRGLAVVYAATPADAAYPSGRWALAAALSPGVSATADNLAIPEFAPFDVQVSVDRQALLLAGGGAAEPGRVAPGVNPNGPDTTVPAVPGWPARFAYPSNIALNGPFVVTNSGNVLVAPTLLTPNQTLAEPVGVSSKYRSPGGLLAAGPVTLPSAAYSSLGGNLSPALSGAAAGEPEARVAGAGNSNAPIPLGQALGNYSGGVVYFLDIGGTPGQLDFVDGLTGAVTNTGARSFDPRRDEPLEPVLSVPTSLRVTETRLPYNDFYSADTEPVLRFDYAGGVPSSLQVMWVSNRKSVATGAANADAGTSPADAALSTYPGNILFGNATLATNGNYRNYGWDTMAQALTATTVAANPGSVNGSPETLNIGSTPWALWHQSLRQGAGFRSTLQYQQGSGTGWSGAPNFIYATGLPKQGIRAFSAAAGTWLFWTEGENGRQELHYRWNFTGTADNNEGPVPISNAVSPQFANDVINDFASGGAIRKPAASPFVYVKDPAPFLWSNGTAADQVHVVFSGFTTRQHNEDLCWAAFDMAGMNDPKLNYGKLTFPRVVGNPVLPDTGAGVRAGEQLTADGLRQTFNSRHLDWLVSNSFETTNLGGRDGRDPRFYVAIVRGATENLYSVDWDPARARYIRARGVYQVTPILAPVGGAPTLATLGIPNNGGVLINPLAGGNPVIMEIEPASGTVTFSSPLFNASNPSDTGAICNRGIAGLAGLTNVVLLADYTPFIFRVTESEASDDSPNVFAEADSADRQQLRLVFFWRRSYTQKDTPHFGRTDFMYKTWTLGTQVAFPPISGASVTGAAGNFSVNQNAGIVTLGGNAATTGVFWLQSPYEGAAVEVRYSGADGANHTEIHRVMGWSQEQPVPVDTVQNEGPLRVAAEPVPLLGGAMTSWRYWLIWSSPRPVYDLRAAGNNGAVIHQSSDVFLGAVVPPYGTGLREQEAEWQNVQ
ncbi:MAG TPA: hypothetical protein VGM19_05525 [Armatimonadota bacterium]|jgi:hypothetical protein